MMEEVNLNSLPNGLRQFPYNACILANSKPTSSIDEMEPNNHIHVCTTTRQVVADGCALIHPDDDARKTDCCECDLFQKEKMYVTEKSMLQPLCNCLEDDHSQANTHPKAAHWVEMECYTPHAAELRYKAMSNLLCEP